MNKIFKNIKGRKILIALVGLGRISKKHVTALAKLNSRAEIVAICDPVEELISQSETFIKEEHDKNGNKHNKIAKYNKYSDLLKAISSSEIKIDLIVLTTPSGLHAQQVVDGSKLGVNMCTEKPMATRWNDGLRMVKACDDAGVRLFVVKQNRFNQTLQLTKEQISSGRLGRIALVTVNVFWQRPQSYYDQADWRGTWEFDGGALMNQASHYVDLLDWLIGPVQSVNASIATIERQIEVEDTAVMNIRWRNGALGTLAVTMLAYPKNIEGSITILGQKGTIKIGGNAVNKIEIWEFEDSRSIDNKIEEVSYETTSVYGFGHEAYYSNLLDALEGKDNPLCDGREGLKSLEILIGAYRSAQTSQPVHFPLDF